MLPYLTKEIAQKYLNMLRANDEESKLLALTMLSSTRYKRLPALRYWSWVCIKEIEKFPLMNVSAFSEFHHLMFKLQQFINK